MEWLNYHHLLYFWVVARTGSIARARAELRLTQPTISGQIQKLEESLGAPLFVREGRGLVLTEVGRLVYRYADEIFSLGREMVDAVRGQPTGRPLRLSVGIADVIPKLVAYRLLAAVRELPQRVVLTCREDRADRLLGELAVHTLDLVLADTPLPPGTHVRAYSHLLGECGVVLCAAPELARTLGGKRGATAGAQMLTPRELHGAPFLMPAEGTQIRRSLEQWFRDSEIEVEIAGEFDDSALLKVFGGAGAGLFAAPEVIEKEVCAHYGVKVVARVPEIRERFYAISPERRI
jgi:LysR family transcriptional regulator, transcriptional activator of nhaA